jgi:hypothetical protein
METTIYTYVNKKVKLLTFDRYYLVKNKLELAKLIDKFCDYDAVVTPDGNPNNFNYPLVLELLPGFGFEFIFVDSKDVVKNIKENIKKNQKMISILGDSVLDKEPCITVQAEEIYSPKEARRLSAWLSKSADWLEQKLSK